MPRRNSPSLFLNQPLLIIILPTIAILLLLFAVRSLLSLNSHKIRPNTVNKGWDSLSVSLVLFAILCGIFARRNDDESANNDKDDDRITHSSRNVVRSKAEQQHSSASNNWFDDYQFPDQKIHSNPTFSTPVASTAGRLSKHRSAPTSSDYIQQRKRHSTMEEIPADTFVLRRSVPSPPPPPKSPPPPPPIRPPPRADHIRSERRSYRAVSDSSKEKVERDGSSEFAEIKSLPPTPRPPPPPFSTQSDHKYRKSERKRSNATKERGSFRRQILQATPPSAPPPPPQTFRRRNSTSIGRPPLPTKVDNFNEENVNRRGQSPLIPMRPPPRPPFKVPGFQFLLNRGFVKIRRTHSSRCNSSDFDEIDWESTATVNVADRRDGSGGPVFCPSPDVNVLADTFIAGRKRELRLEKINSMKEKKRSMGQGPG